MTSSLEHPTFPTSPFFFFFFFNYFYVRQKKYSVKSTWKSTFVHTEMSLRLFLAIHVLHPSTLYLLTSYEHGHFFLISLNELWIKKSLYCFQHFSVMFFMIPFHLACFSSFWCFLFPFYEIIYLTWNLTQVTNEYFLLPSVYKTFFSLPSDCIFPSTYHCWWYCFYFVFHPTFLI